MTESWVTQSQGLMQAWTEAQARLWGDWADMAAKAGTLSAPAAGNQFEQWQAMGRSVVDAWPWDTDGVSRQIVERMFFGEEAFLQVVTQTLDMLRVVAPKIEVGDEWVELLRRYLDSLKNDALNGQVSWFRPDSLSGASEDVAELWRLYIAETERFTGPWIKDLQHNIVHLGEAARGDRGAIGKMVVSSMDAFEATFGRLISAPGVGQSRETTERLTRSFDAWADMNRAGVEFQNDILSQGFKAWEDVVQELVDMGERGETVTSLHQLFELYVSTAEKGYYNLFSTGAFAEVQGRLVNASMEFRKRQRDLLDELLASMDMPGRSEVDQIHRHVHDLRRELRYVKRDMASLQTELERAHAALEAKEASSAASPASPQVSPVTAGPPAEAPSGKPQQQPQPTAPAAGSKAPSAASGAAVPTKAPTPEAKAPTPEAKAPTPEATSAEATAGVTSAGPEGVSGAKGGGTSAAKLRPAEVPPKAKTARKNPPKGKTSGGPAGKKEG